MALHLQLIYASVLTDSQFGHSAATNRIESFSSWVNRPPLFTSVASAQTTQRRNTCVCKIQDGGATPASTKTTISRHIYHRVNLSQRKH